jgi:uncharacterized protein YidB (DUF937 family)
MGLMDMISGAVERHPEVNQEQHASLLQTAMQMFGNHGGISGLLNNARSQGLGETVQSWIGTGANQSVSAEQVENLIGQDRINQLAGRVGISPETARAALARILPVIVDKATPQGTLPKAA